jgi:hypothetical protein
MKRKPGAPDVWHLIEVANAAGIRWVHSGYATRAVAVRIRRQLAAQNPLLDFRVGRFARVPQ